MTQVGGYELIESLGPGSHGESFLARPPSRLGLGVDHVVVKILAAEASDESWRRVGEELALAASLGCDQLVSLYEVGREGTTLFYASAHHAQGSLARPAAVPSRSLVLRAVADAARGAHALHQAGIVHGNVKPSNVVLDGAGGRLADIGLAAILSDGPAAGITTVEAMEFAEPAVLLGERVGRASDVWSLAVTLHRALTGTSIHGEIPSGSRLGALRHVVESEPVLAADLEPGEAELVAWCTRPERSDRPATAAVLADRLDALADATAPGGHDTAPPDVLESIPLRPGGGERRGALSIDGRAPATVLSDEPAHRELRPQGYLVFDDGRAYALDVDWVVGREPHLDDAVRTGRASPIALDDPGNAVSRVHVEIRVVDAEVHLIDRGSTNGTRLWDPIKEDWQRLVPGRPTVIQPGDHGAIGRRTFVYEPRA